MRTRALTPSLKVADVAASLAWYGLLGFEETRRFESAGVLEWALAVNGAQRLMLNRSRNVDPAAQRARPGHGDVQLHLTVDDAHAARAELAAHGLAPGPVERQDHGVDAFLLRDPDGYELAVIGELTQLA